MGHRHFLHIPGLAFLFVSCLAYLVVVLPTLPFNLEAKTVYTQINVLFLSLFWECFRLAALGGVQCHIICPIISANIVLFVPTLARHAQFFDRVSNVGLALSAARNGTLTDLLFQIPAPQNAGWTAIGTRDRMDRSLMFIIYPSSQSNGEL